jgi:serine/threonine protein kinase
MAIPTTTVRDYCTLLAKSKLLPADEVEGLQKRWRSETRGGDEQVDEFRKFLTSRRYLTEWQAHMVQRGRADGFFIGGYKILDRIGKGQMGGVYKAVHSLGQIVALKILPASKAKDQHTLGRFQRESRLLTQLDHPNVVRAYQVGESGGVHFIGMEFLEGETLDEVLSRRKRLPWAEAARLMHQALGGLQHLHEKRMVHRDMKPANMMLTPPATKPDTTWDATLKILDIGLGRELFAEDAPEGQIETQLTAEGAVLGTPDYLAPEQAKNASGADIRADIYSVGCVLYHCLAGRTPFPATNIMTQMLMHATEKAPPLASLVPDVPAGLQSVVEVMMAKSPNDRYLTPAMAAGALRPFLGTGGSAPVMAPLVPAYKAWLESESQLDRPANLPPATAPAKPLVADTRPHAPLKPATAPATALPATPAPKSGPTAVPAVRPTAPAKPIAPAQAAPPYPAARPYPAAAPLQPVHVPVEVDVELVPEPAPMMLPVQEVPAAKVERSLFDPDRRDWIMLAAGATGVLLAVGLGYGVARLLRKPPEELPPAE